MMLLLGVLLAVVAGMLSIRWGLDFLRESCLAVLHAAAAIIIYEHLLKVVPR